ncbi:hypothetical protein DM01DRAFT_1339604 [Hesseltinella vesiculosa]|uniref:F-box domain-containing protein n=1 Tax=Hesseltinella vesiculosa TaxID=101127 RepID=A0A1X2G6E8_9FUNG|nr:hypothetical protein DM01DRAFT_1339604 [Hesseltinella vesiculosa]
MAAFPSELLLYIFTFCHGDTLLTSRQVCSQWLRLIDHYDALVWSSSCHHDFQRGLRRRFWSLEFPHPHTVNRLLFRQDTSVSKPITWQDLYRLARAWSHGSCRSFYVDTADTQPGFSLAPSLVVGSLQEQHFFTSLSVTHSGYVVRSNPTYKSASNLQALVLQQLSPHLPCRHVEDTALHGIVCHYSDPSSSYIVTGGVDGTVSLWHERHGCKATWQAHRSRVLCVNMNDQVVVSGGSDGMIRVWDVADNAQQRGSIDISSYLTGDWFQHGVGELAVNGHLVVCAPDASGPVLIFSILTGSLVYELKTEPLEATAFSRLCLTPFYLLTKGELRQHNRDQVPVYPRAALQSHEHVLAARQAPAQPASFGSLVSMPDTDDLLSSSGMSPYQLARHFASVSPTSPTSPSCSLRQTSSLSVPCINVWDLQTGQLAYRMVPPCLAEDIPPSSMSITDIQVSPHTAHVFACVEVRFKSHRYHRLCCWDFSRNQSLPSLFPVPPLSNTMATGAAWACVYP